jgi:hypothetical protein
MVRDGLLLAGRKSDPTCLAEAFMKLRFAGQRKVLFEVYAGGRKRREATKRNLRS